jgi:hypothetical protein
MNAPKLILHAGGRLCDRNQLASCITPTGTHSHRPIPHMDLVELTADRLDQIGLKIVSQQHALSHHDNRYFGMFGLAGVGNDGASAQDGYELILGLRNSHDKTFPAGLALGSHVFICDNLAFSGEVKIARKHTVNILRDLPRLVTVAVNRVASQRQTMANRIERYRNHELNDAQAHDLIVRSLDHQVITATKIEKVVREWRKPAHEDFAPRTAWSLFNAFTETMKEYSVDSMYKRSQPLHGLFDAACGVSVN